MKKDKETSWDREITDECPILYCMRDASMQETCMCWGFECGEGWKEPLRKLSTALEALNLAYWPKYKIRIQADQVKEKFGILHFYYSVVKDSSWHKRILYSFFRKIDMKLRKIDYKMKTVVDKEAWTEHRVEELKTKAEYVEAKYFAKNCTNVKFEEKDGKWLKTTELKYCQQAHNEPTTHKLLHKLMTFARKMSIRLDSYGEEMTLKQVVIYNFLDDQARKLVKEAEDECYNVCEECGNQIGEGELSPRCTTVGWITYICDDCAKNKEFEYFMNGALYCKGKCTKTKELMEAEKAAIEARRKEARKKWEAEEDEYEKELEAAKKEDLKHDSN